MKEYPKTIEEINAAARKRRFIRGGVLVALLAAIAVVLTLGGSLIDDITSIGESRFPLETGSEHIVRLTRAKDYFLTATEKQYIIYNKLGERISAKKHGFGSPVAMIAGEFSLIFENGGNHLVTLNKSKTFLNKSFDVPLITADIAENGNVCIATSDEKYMSAFTAFDKNGKEKFKWMSENQLVAARLSKNGRFAVCAAVRVDDGSVKTVISGLDLGVDTQLFELVIDNALCLGLYRMSSGYAVVCDNKVVFFSDKGKVSAEVELSGSLILAYAAASGDVYSAKAGDFVALAVQTLGKYELLVCGKDGVKAIASFDAAPLALAIDGNLVFAATIDTLFVYDLGGNEKNRLPLGEESSGLLAFDKTVYVTGAFSVAEMSY